MRTVTYINRETKETTTSYATAKAWENFETVLTGGSETAERGRMTRKRIEERRAKRAAAV